MAIPHNSNLSNGLMYDTNTLEGDPLTSAYASMRMRFEPPHEMSQMKGDSETHPELSPDDEFAWTASVSLRTHGNRIRIGT